MPYPLYPGPVTVRAMYVETPERTKLENRP
ncbi:hypothetical protein BPODLACK_02767 [Gordonia sp. YY1]|nr:hypothetical protein BPODLACK_02767 [Gordonia sp. YY1]